MSDNSRSVNSTDDSEEAMTLSNHAQQLLSLIEDGRRKLAVRMVYCCIVPVEIDSSDARSAIDELAVHGDLDGLAFDTSSLEEKRVVFIVPKVRMRA